MKPIKPSKKTKLRITFIDPMSYHNLMVYDESIITNLPASHAVILGNSKGTSRYGTLLIPVFRYSKYRNLPKVVSYILSAILVFLICLFRSHDVIHVQWIKMHAFEYVIYYFLRKFRNVALVLTMHNVLPHNTGDRYTGINTRLCRLFDRIIVHTSATKKEIKNLLHVPNEKVWVIPHGPLNIGNERTLAIPLIPETQNRRLQVGFLGTISEYKGLRVLERAWPQLSQLDIHLIIAGRGKINEQFFAPNIASISIDNRSLTDSEFLNYLLQCDVVLLPYIRVSQSGLLFTCIHYHIPFVVSDLPGLREPLDISHNIGWKVPPNDITALVQMIQDLSLQPEMVRQSKCAKESWDRVNTHYSWANIGRLTQEAYYDAIRG